MTHLVCLWLAQSPSANLHMSLVSKLGTFSEMELNKKGDAQAIPKRWGLEEERQP
jgi:hypothetical protein